jgi:RNA polymerase sigma-70 factor (ECF subfamily)
MVGRDSKVRVNESARLMRKVADGDLEAFDRLYLRFAPSLMHFFVKRGADLTLADDLTQNVFISLWERRREYRADSSFEAYLFSVAKHSFSKEIRQSHKAAEKGLKRRAGLIGDSHDRLSEPELELYLKELAAAVERAKAQLTDEQRKALEAPLGADIPLGKVVKELGCTRGAFKNRLKRARKRLRKLLAPFLSED